MSTSEEKIYQLGEEEYIMPEIKLGQMQQLAAVLLKIAPEGLEDLSKNIESNPEEATLKMLASGELSNLLAVLLLRKGEVLADKDKGSLQRKIEEQLDSNEAMEILNDFFIKMAPAPQPKSQTEQPTGSGSQKSTGTTT